MPKHPLYVDFLKEEARAVIGEVHPQTLPARCILESEGMKYEGYVDIFDAGPTLEAYVKELRAVKESKVCRVKITDDVQAQGNVPYLIANDKFTQYRALIAYPHFSENHICLTAATAESLNLTEHDTVRAVSLFSQEKQS